MRHARIAAIGMACLAYLAVAASSANAGGTAKGQDGRMLSDAQKQRAILTPSTKRTTVAPSTCQATHPAMHGMNP
jgi:hypothetical protein